MSSSPLEVKRTGCNRDCPDACGIIATVQDGRVIKLQGDPPNPIDPPEGCRFSSRCSFVCDICREKTPALQEVAAGHLVACHRIGGGEILK